MQPIPPLPPLSQLIQQAQSLTGTPALYAIGIGAFIVVAARDWRLVLAGFTAITLGSALLTSTLLPPEWALVRVIVGGLVAIMWYLSAQRAGWGGYFLPFQRQGGVWARPLSSTTLFRTLLALALAGGLLATRPRLPLPPLPTDVQAVVIWLGAFAILGLALGDEALQAGAGSADVAGRDPDSVCGASSRRLADLAAEHGGAARWPRHGLSHDRSRLGGA